MPLGSVQCDTVVLCRTTLTKAASADQPNPMRDVVTGVSAAVSLLVGWCVGELAMC